MKDISVHDNVLISYDVLCQKQEIRFHTVYLDSEPHEYTDLTFSGVVAYHFVNDNLQTIIFDIEEGDLENVYAANEELFIRGKNYAWPVSYESKEDLILKMRNENIKAFIINSSYGLDGWVWARELEATLRHAPGDSI